MRVYRIQIWQDHGAYLRGYDETLDVRAPTAMIALRRALALARANGFQKSKPLRVKSLVELSEDLL